MISPTINISIADTYGAWLNFSHWFHIIGGDCAEVYIRPDSSTPWMRLDKFTGYNDDHPFWSDKTYFIAPEYCTETFQVKFRFYSNAEDFAEGYCFDDVAIIMQDGSSFGPEIGTILADTWFTYNDGYTDNAFAWTAGDPWQSAIILTDPELAAFRGDVIDEVKVSTGCDAYGFYAIDLNIYVGDGALPDMSTVTPVFTGVSSGTGWDIFDIPDHFIPSTGDVYIIVEWFDYTGMYPAGFDTNNYDDRGGWLNYIGSTYDWRLIDSLGYDAVWGIDAGISAGVIPDFGETIWLDDFERDDIFPWTCIGTSAGDFWRHYTSYASGYLPCGETTDADGDEDWWVIHGYGGVGPGLNNALYTTIDLTGYYNPITCQIEPYTYAKLHFSTLWCVEDEVEMWIEISSDYDGGDMEDATWIPYWHYPTPQDILVWPSGGWIDSTELVLDDRFELNQYLGQVIYLRFRFTTPSGCDAFSILEDHGWAVDELTLEFKTEVFADEEAPVTQIFINKETSQATLIAEDYPINKGCGVKAIYYKIDGGAQQTYVGAFAIPEGTHTIEYWAEDNCGNVEMPHKSTTYTIDATAPTVELIKPEEGKLYLFGNPIMDRILGSTTLCIGKVPVAASADDGTGSGVSMVIFSFDNGDTGFDDDGSDGFEYMYRGMHFGDLTITAVAIDNVGLTSTPDSMTITVYSLGLL
jgi:hypothetical protein